MSSAFWDRTATHYDKDVQQHGDLYDKTIDATADYLTASDVVLDLGCASGEYSLDIAPLVKQVHGIDISAKMIDLAQQKAQNQSIDNIEFSQTDLFDSSLTDKGYTAVVAFNIFHLVPKAEKVFQRLHKLLPDGGLLISQTPCLGEHNIFIRGMIRGAGMVGLAPKVRNFTPSELESAIASSGFDIVDSRVWEEANNVQWIVGRKR